MRKLMWFAVGFAAAVALCAYLLSGVWTIVAIVVSLLALIVLKLLKNKINPVVFVVFIGLAAGLLYSQCYDGIVLSKAKQYDGKTLRITMTATDYSFQTDSGNIVDGKSRIDGKNHRIRLYYRAEDPVEPGDLLKVRATLRYTPSDSVANSTYHKGEGVFLIALAENTPIVEKADTWNIRYLATYIRKAMSDRISMIFPEDVAAFAKALLLGADHEISFADNIAFQRSGIRHVIAVSGLHVSILFSVVYFVTGRKRLPMLLCGFPVLFLFAAVAGFSPSVVRACVMQALLILSFAVDKEYDAGTALAFSCMVMLVLNPLVITSVSFQLSVGCMIGIFLFSQPIRDRFYSVSFLKCKKKKSFKAKLVRWFTGSVSVSVSAMIFTMPLCALYFDIISVIGIVTNLLALWVISYVFYGIILACLISFIWLPAAGAIAYIVAFPIRYVITTAKLLSRISAGFASTDSPFVLLWVLLTGVLILCYVIRKKKSLPILAVTVTALYALAVVATWAIPRMDNFRLTVVDVGQGQCILLQSNDEVYMIDCGGEDPQYTASAAMNAMHAQGINRIDGLILTHYDEDHCNGIENLLQCFSVDKLYLPDTDQNTKNRLQLEKQEIPIRWISGNVTLSCSAGKIQIIPAKIHAEGNESSMCILFQGENCDILITGDRDMVGETELLSQETLPKLEVLVIGHHGASTSTGEALLEATRPELAIVSVGKNNRHGHPGMDVLNRLEYFGCKVRRTDMEGTIMIRG